MNRLSLTVTIVLFVGATAANAQFGSGIVSTPHNRAMPSCRSKTKVSP